MRNTKILSQQDTFNYDLYWSQYQREFTPEQIAEIQIRMYLFIHNNEIRQRYAEYIYEELVLQNPQIAKPLYGIVWSDYRKKIALEFILKHIISCEDCFVLCDPENGEPSVVVSSYDFISHKELAKSNPFLLDHIQYKMNNTPSLFDELSGKTLKNGAKWTGGHLLGQGSNYLYNSSGRLNALAKHYSSNHATHMRITHSFRGNISQQKAFSNTIQKSGIFAQQAARKKVGGSILSFLAKKMKGGSFKPITFADIFLNPTETGRGADIGYQERSHLESVLPSELSKYCNNNSNYRIIMNQQYFEQK
ncbi:hypothetical protein [Dysgonomonas sp. 25]|uniref:hypothetical protein n=1 Tax=Dysgonomonas sp. 25 TaxID=2302933 RepID=UPI0013D3F56D|nr:hypothetical protein [Dysgonomonas sp. 25]NDV67912.1 hypothetical protein [Dysgonomonas sp. 25]